MSVSFDYDNDALFKETLVGQCRLTDSPLSINDMSLRQVEPEWQGMHRRQSKTAMVLYCLLATTLMRRGEFVWR